MDRRIVYPGALPQDTDILLPQRAAMIGLGALAKAALGSATAVDGLTLSPTAPASMTVNIGPGSIITFTSVDSTPFGSLAADTTDALVKMGINLASTPFILTAPATSGQSINYLIEAAFSETDGGATVLPYLNAANPAQPYAGPNNTGASQNTVRQQRVGLQLKAGAPAAAGTQATPAPDTGWTGLYVITVNFGQTTVTSSSVAMYPGAPFIDAAGTGRGVQPGRYLGYQRITSTATYVPRPGCNRIIVETQAAGGGSAGVPGANNAALVAAGQAGSSGQYAKGEFLGPFTGILVTVGTGGTGGAAGQNNGAAGGPTSFGSLQIVGGGPGGLASAPAAPPFVNGGGQVSSNTIVGGNIENGDMGSAGGLVVAMSTSNYSAAPGGASHFSRSAAGTSGVASANLGALGGGGAGVIAPGTNTLGIAGARGGDGIVIIHEFSF